MNEALQAKIEELSLLLVMASAEDPSSVTLVLETVQELHALSEPLLDCSAVAEACAEALKLKGSADPLTAVNSLASALNSFVAGDVAALTLFLSAKSSTIQGTDFAPNLDPAFVTEFIESHSLLLEEFEGNLVASSRDNPNPEEFSKVVKRYLHNLKGDAGSVGLLGIERVCHKVEDLVGEHGAVELVTQLLTFKEWVVHCMLSLREGQPVASSASEFLEGLGEGPSSKFQVVPPAGALSPKAAGPHLEKLQAHDAPLPVAQGADRLPQTYRLSGELDILIEFVAEAEEHLGIVEALILESTGDFSKDSVDAIFRAVHSIKGGSAYFALVEMTKCSHLLENMLHEVRDGKRNLDERLKSLLLTYIDLQKEVMKRSKGCASTGTPMATSGQAQTFLDDLHSYASGVQEPTQKESSREVTPAPKTSSPAPRPTPEGEKESGGDNGEKLQVKNFVKVDTARLDHLIDSIGEMVIYSAMLVRQCREHLEGDQVVMNTTHRVEKFARDLQDVGMSMRLVPIKGLFQKMSRLVWDTSKKLGKELDFRVEGEDTELDRNLIDKLADPLMHMVRNALDHGIESPEGRQAAGKPRAGHVKLAAYHSGGSIHIEISDDGKGLDPDKLITKAIEKGVISPNQRLSNEEAYQLIFAAGFSTAAVVTDISGRGVGMDVVRRNVEALRGRIKIRSEVNKGSTFIIELPLTLAIIDGIQVRVGTENFIIPSLSIIEFVRPSKGSVSSTLDRGETFMFRERYLPVFRLSSLYGIESSISDLTQGAMVIVEHGTEYIGLFVDAILGEYSTVIKNLGPLFADQKGTAGCAIMPDGDISLILDVRSLVELARAVYLPPASAKRNSNPEPLVAADVETHA